jgi:DNA-binding beta-propeller fold protein YncE
MTMKTAPAKPFLEYLDTVGLATMLGRGFYYPVDTAIDSDGRLYVVSRSIEGDNRGVRITVCDLDHEYYGTFGEFGEGDGQFIYPTSVAIDSQGRIYVSDEHLNRITVFDDSRNFTGKWGVEGTNAGELDGPSGLTFDGDDNLYVVDHRNHRVQKFTAHGTFLMGFGSEGHGDGDLSFPWGLAIGPSGDVYVADWHNDRVQRFSPDGEFLASYGSPGRGDGQLHRPAWVAIDGDGYIYVCDWGNERVQVLDPDGGFVAKLMGEATESRWAQDFLNTNLEEGGARARANLDKDIDFFVDDPHERSSHIEKLFWAPTSVKLDAAGRLYVTDSNRHRLQVYQRSF